MWKKRPQPWNRVHHPGRFWVDIRTLFQTQLKHPANELDDEHPRTAAFGRAQAGHTSLVNPRWARRRVAYRTTVPSDVSWQNGG